MTTPRQALGRWGEASAVQYLSGRGYTVLECNARTPYGEIDLVAQHVDDRQPGGVEGDLVTVFVEVKTRSTRTFGRPEVSVTPRKQAHMIAAAQFYLQQHPELEGDWRIDVIAIERDRSGGSTTIRHFENAVF